MQFTYCHTFCTFVALVITDIFITRLFGLLFPLPDSDPPSPS
uniref:Uncharacterized protein n=1 Tax=Rhizophora mucronata TaxID=61149 RepID=A0A2P2PWY8_RHIMU